MLVECILFVCLFQIVYTWFGYVFILYLASQIIPKKVRQYPRTVRLPKVTIIVSAYNEEKIIGTRIKNILSLDYPEDLTEVLIGSDGSTDRTVEIAERYARYNVKIISFKENKGRADVHNELVKVATGEILIFTDADSLFEKNFVRSIVKPFNDMNVGGAIGKLCYLINGGTVAEGEGVYWKHELFIKSLEDALGVINTGTGACMAIRKWCFKTLSPVDDVDTATIIDIGLQRLAVAYVSDAIAYDYPPHSMSSEFKMRVRGTSKTIASIVHRYSICEWVRHPVLAWSLMSHRISRYLSPYFAIIALACNISLFACGRGYQMLFWAQATFYFLAILGLIGDVTKKRIFVASGVFSFCLALSGMMVGVAKAAVGKAKVTYMTEDVFR